MADVVAAAERGPLRNRAFLALWLAQILSQVAANATTFALIVLVGERTRSNVSSSILILLAVVPPVVFGIFAGIVADRTDRKRILVTTNALRAAAMVIFLLSSQDVAGAFLTNLLVSLVTVFFVPAEAATIPSILPRQHLLAANSLFTFTFNGAFLLGFVLLAPLVLALADYEVLFVLLAAMFGAAALLCVTLPGQARGERRLGVGAAGEAFARTRRGVAEAFGFLGSNPVLAWSLVYVAIANTLIAVAGALAPGFVREVLGLGERSVVVLVAPAGLGVIAGLVLLNLVGSRISRADATGVALVLLGGALVALALSRPFAAELRGSLPTLSAALGGGLAVFIAVIGAVSFALGLAYAMILVPSMTMLQEELREDIRGRVFGVLNMLVSLFSFLPLVVVGPIADAWGVAPVFLGAAVVVWAAWLAGGRARREARPRAHRM